jgi:hypothetical protein
MNSMLDVWIGANDLGGLITANPASYYTSLNSYWQTARSDGFKVARFTIMNRSDHQTASDEAARAALNQMIVTNGATEVLVDVSYFVSPTNNLYSDGSGVHLNQAGQNVVSNLIVSAWNAWAMTNKFVGHGVIRGHSLIR